jgi:DNA polymerase-3 subunit epsilon
LYAVVDIETTGNGYRGQRITEISIFVFDGKKVIEEFTSLVNPEQNIPPFITNLTGINNAMVRTAPKFYEIAKNIEELTKDKIFVAHNVNFDYNILRQEFKDLGFNFVRKKLCTVRLSRKIIPKLKSYSLGNICSAEGISISDRHRAKGDAQATVALFKKLIDRDNEFIIDRFLNHRSKQATLPPLLDKLTVDNLPEKPGVYYFKNLQKKVIYVGKAINIRQRVMSHFYDKNKKEIAMCLEIANISYEETGSELLALLKESADIKHMYPKYNRSQKTSNESVGLFDYEDQQGIIHLAYNRLKLVSNPLMEFTSITQCRKLLEKICVEYELCPKYCHLQTNISSCFHYQIKACKGICSQKEAITEYNNRVKKAIASLGFQGEDLVIKEKGRTHNEIGFVLIMNGLYKGYGYLDKNIELAKPNEYLFYLQPQKNNKDTQRILRWYWNKSTSNAKN